MYVLYTTQSRLRISAPFYLIFNSVHVATPTACIYIILFNFLSDYPQTGLLMYVLYTTQSRLRISVPFYLIFNNVHVAIPTACIYIILFNFLKSHYAIPFTYLWTILFNFQWMWDLIQNKNARGAFCLLCFYRAHVPQCGFGASI